LAGGAVSDEADRYQEAFHRADETGELFGDDEEAETQDTPTPELSPADANGRRSPVERSLELPLVAGFVLRTKTEGWKHFCERVNEPADAFQGPLLANRFQHFHCRHRRRSEKQKSAHGSAQRRGHGSRTPTRTSSP
jgi:hypothetical protein